MAINEWVQAEAKRAGRPVAQVTGNLMTVGENDREHHGQGGDEVQEAPMDGEHLRRKFMALAALVRSLEDVPYGALSDDGSAIGQ